MQSGIQQNGMEPNNLGIHMTHLENEVDRTTTVISGDAQLGDSS